MKIHLTRTIDFPMEMVKNIAYFLNQFSGPITFIADDFFVEKKQVDHRIHYEIVYEKPVDTKVYSYIDNKGLIFMCECVRTYSCSGSFIPDLGEYLNEMHSAKTLAWKEIFDYCDYYRKYLKIDKHDFVVLLSEKPNEHNWFSMVDNDQNIYVHTENNWGEFKHENMPYFIAYQIMENVLQNLMGIDIITKPKENIHYVARGCMNDFCNTKSDVLLKLQTANICNDCIKKIKEENIDETYLTQVLLTFDAVRKKIIYNPIKLALKPPELLVINKKNQLLIPSINNIEIVLTPLYKTLYIFFLMQANGIKLKDITDQKKLLLKIYKQLAINENPEKIEKNINNLASPLGESFLQKRAKINVIIAKILGNEIACHYLLDGKRGEPYSINLPKHLIDFSQSKFKDFI